MIRTYTVDSNKIFQLLEPGEDQIKESIAFVLEGTGIVRSVQRPFGKQYFDVIVESNQDASPAVLQGFYNVGFTSAVMIRVVGGADSTSLLGELFLSTKKAVAPMLGSLGMYVLVLAIAVAIILIGIFLMKGGKAN
jgi:hypothetical protein